MNIYTFSPALVLLYVFILLWILMGVDTKALGQTQRRLVFFAVLLLGTANHLLRGAVGSVTYGKLLIICLHFPVFLLFLYIAKRGAVKTAFMIFTALVFTAPIVLIGNLVRRVLFVDSPAALLISNLISYAAMLLLAQFVFRSGFNYLLTYADNRFFLRCSLVPLMYYIYVLASVNLDFSSLSSTAGFLVQLMPHFQVFLFYFLLLYVYKSLSENNAIKVKQNAMQQKLVSVEEQIELLNEVNAQMAIFRHDVRHKLIVLGGLLSGGKNEEARKFVETAVADLNTLTPKHFCENETVNVLCRFYDSKAGHQGIRLTINALLPKSLPLSDTELCSIISNGLENANMAASLPGVTDRWVDFSCKVMQNKIFMQIQNSYAGEVVIRNGLPVSLRDGHGYGCRSIQTIVQHNDGLCSFEADNGIFSLRIAIPIKTD